MTELESTFLRIKKAFFPKWDREQLWGVSGSLSIGSGHICPDGHCCMKERMLHVLTGHADYERMLVHLVCHAVTANNHESHWHARMRKAVEQASHLHHHALAHALQEDIDYYIQAPKPSVPQVEKISCQTALELPESSEEVWLEVVAANFRMTGAELRRKYPAAPSRGFKRAGRMRKSMDSRQLVLF